MDPADLKQLSQDLTAHGAIIGRHEQQLGDVGDTLQKHLIQTGLAEQIAALHALGQRLPSASPVSHPPSGLPSASPVSHPPSGLPSASPVSHPPSGLPSASPVSHPPSVPHPAPVPAPGATIHESPLAPPECYSGEARLSTIRASAIMAPYRTSPGGIYHIPGQGGRGIGLQRSGDYNLAAVLHPRLFQQRCKGSSITRPMHTISPGGSTG